MTKEAPITNSRSGIIATSGRMVALSRDMLRYFTGMLVRTARLSTKCPSTKAENLAAFVVPFRFSPLHFAWRGGPPPPCQFHGFKDRKDKRDGRDGGSATRECPGAFGRWIWCVRLRLYTLIHAYSRLFTLIHAYLRLFALICAWPRRGTDRILGVLAHVSSHQLTLARLGSDTPPPRGSLPTWKRGRYNDEAVALAKLAGILSYGSEPCLNLRSLRILRLRR